MEIIEINDNFIPDYPEEYHPIYDIKLDTFKNIKSANIGGEIQLWDLFQNIKYNLNRGVAPNVFLTPKYYDGTRNPEYDNIKNELETVSYNARFNGYKNLANLSQINNIMFLDIDDFTTKEETLSYKSEIVKKYDWFLACSLSLSRLGLHVIIYVDDILNNKDFNKKYDYINKTYFEGRLDKSAKSLTRHAIIPYDYNIYINKTPTQLLLNKEFNCSSKGIRSDYIKKKDSNISNNKLNENSSEVVFNGLIKGTCSDYNEREEKKKIIDTPHTFSDNKSIATLPRYGKKLKLKYEPNEDDYTDPDIPIYYRDGLNVIEVRLYLYRNKKKYVKERTSFIGAITAQVIVLNVEAPELITQEIRKKVLNFMLSVNNKYCSPPLSKDEVIKSVNANWKSFISGELNVDKYLKPKRSFWSKECSLSTNEKRKYTCNLNSEPIVAKSKHRISEAIQSCMDAGENIRQKKVAELSGLKLPTVKKYWKYYKLSIKDYKDGLTKNVVESETGFKQKKKIVISGKLETTSQTIDDTIITPDTPTNAIHLHQFATPIKESIKDNNDSKLQHIYQMIYKNFFKHFNELEKTNLYEKFCIKYESLPEEDKKVISLAETHPEYNGLLFTRASIESQFHLLCEEVYKENVI